MKETNMEHHRGEIEENGYAIALVNGKIERCSFGTPNEGDPTQCLKCKFDEGETCVSTFTKWLMSEYKPEPVLTQREKHFVEFAQEGWLARDEEGSIDLHISKPYKQDWYWDNKEHEYCHLNNVAHNLFRFITWEDEEPWAVSDLRKLKALEYNPEDVAFKKGGQNV